MQWQAGRELVTNLESVTELHDLAQLAAFADAIYADHWVGRRMTPSAYGHIKIDTSSSFVTSEAGHDSKATALGELTALLMQD